jgi:VanZ family protein
VSRSASLRWRVALAVLLAVHLGVLYAPDTGGAPPFPNFDKIVHATTFASVVLAGLAAGLAARWWVPVVSAHALVSELVQHWLLPHRTGDVTDVLADLVGVAVGVLAVRLLRRASWTGDSTGGEPHGTSAGRHAGAG